MVILLFLASCAIGFFALLSMLSASSAIQQAVGAALFVAACVLFVGAAIVDAIRSEGRRLVAALVASARPTDPAFSRGGPHSAEWEP